MDPIEEYFDELQKEIDAIFGWDTSLRSKNGRQILEVNEVTYYSSNYVENSSTVPTSLGYLILKGKPTSSSEVESGVIRFVDSAQIQKPRYEPPSKTISLWIDIRLLELTLSQISHGKRYLWVGEFSNGHVYGDLHSIP